ncbi:Spc24-domain-containing protein [Sodiomyces alkalinus F11]|uniref:Kinetochore protein Spc24 n=1 Tax=Sodiomyces alkalinus (strain CBS 110278 / VKM F-3762 / F11) TaxID=1314773 RepID=A0A3N2Q5V7_SODAK|nr:Spc24-domain-containing protein [Sodiomyces alkalinus F11]ROT42164.1 Spc24-domain-containing protein [Sodiomyces alkalinus F11]
MLLSEDPSTLIHHTINNFNIQPDKQACARISESLSNLQQARDIRIREAENALKKLSRTLNTMSSQHADLTASHSSTKHASEIARLDTKKFRTAKTASDAEVEAERLAQQAADLTARLQELEVQGVDGMADEEARRRRARDPLEDEVVLRLTVYRSLGIEMERGDERPTRSRGSSVGAAGGSGGSGEAFSRAIVRNDRKGDVHVVNMDKKFSRFFYANYFWQTL